MLNLDQWGDYAPCFSCFLFCEAVASVRQPGREKSRKGDRPPVPLLSVGGLEVSLDFLVGKTDMELDSSTLNRIREVSKLPEPDRQQVFLVVDSLKNNLRSFLTPCRRAAMGK